MTEIAIAAAAAYLLGVIGAYAEYSKHKNLNLYVVFGWPVLLFVSLGAWAIYFDQTERKS